jgi:hypothetical protein
MRVAIADPPYPGQSKRLYGDHDAYAGEIDHADLVARLMADYDAWALHTSASALHAVLPHCPAPKMDTKKNKGRYLNGTGTRVLIWIKTMSPWRPVDIQWSWEPILIYGGRPRARGRGAIRDHILCNPQGDPNGFVGAKPRAVSEYVFEALGLEAGDDLDDLFPGSGAIGAAWHSWRAQGRLVA